MEWLVIIVVVLGIVGCVVCYRAGMKRVLKEWRKWNSEFYGNEKCIHNNDFEYCPDCRR